MYKIKLSPYAKTFYVEWLLEPDNYRYNMLSADQILQGNLNITRLRNALNRYVADHVLLNSHIQLINEEPFWVINNSISEFEYSENPISQAELLSYTRQNFDLYNGPLYRFKLIRNNNNSYRFIIILHHLLMDGISINDGVFEEISNYYNDEHYKTKYKIDEQIALLTEFEKKLSITLEKNRNAYKKFWGQQLSEIDNVDLRFLKLKKEDDLSEDYNPVGEITFSFNEAETAKIEQIKNKFEVTSYSYSQCVFVLLLHKYTEQERFAIAYPIAIKEGADFIYGGQVNLNLIPYYFNSTTTFLDVLNQNKQFFKVTRRDDIKYGYLPIAEILQECQNNKQFLDVYFSQAHFRNTPFKLEGITKIQTSNELSIDGISDNTLLFEQEPKANKLNYRVKYNKAVINQDLLNRFISYYKKLFIEISNDLSNEIIKPIINYQLLDQQTINTFNKATKEYSLNKTIHQLFEEQVRKTPLNLAILYKETQLTYQQLNIQANQLAHYLLSNYIIKYNELIAICLDKKEYLMIAILAVLKTGGAYVPLDPIYPEERINYILEDAKITVMITNLHNQDRLRKNERIVLAIDDQQLQEILTKENQLDPQTPVSSENLCYVLYTSGTTGKPKGVLQQHKNVQRLFSATEDYYHFNSNDVWVLFHSYVFDFSVWEMWGALLYGGKLLLPTNDQIRDPNLFYELCHSKKVTVLTQTPTAFYPLMEVAINQFEHKPLVELRYIIFGGESLNFNRLYSWFNLYGYNKVKLINGYGPTETTVFVVFKQIAEIDIGKGSIIGRAIPDQTVYILNKYFKPVPIGAIGELYISGAGLALGYLNQPDLTKQKFIPNLFQTEQEQKGNQNNRLYKTGDLVRCWPDGDIEYICRNDTQIKIRGHRIELAEIENTLMQYPNVQQAVVLAKEQQNEINNKYVVAYYMAENLLDDTNIKDYLAARLPEYMRPTVLVHLKKMPLTINGKIDIKSLPEPIIEINDKYLAPGNEQEKLICSAFSKVLGLALVGVNDDFFKLGGNSLNAIKLTSLLQANFVIKVADIFDLRTVKNIATNVLFGSNMLEHTLEQVKLLYKTIEKNLLYDKKMLQKKEDYIQTINNSKIDCTIENNITTVLLTGATGFLGCNLLNQLLILTNYTIVVLVRADDYQEAINRIKHKYQYYFTKTLDDVLEKRLYVIRGDIEQKKLGLSSYEYKKLATKIDSIIHAAALVKHYGDQDKFYSANVQATINLLELAKRARKKDFHFISTVSVLHVESALNSKNFIYTEDDFPASLDESSNVYSKSKLLAEKEVVKYREHGITTNIYRVGNLAYISENFHTQENLEENAFYNWLKCLFHLKCIPGEISAVELSPVDMTALAIIKIFNKQQLCNSIFHVFNPFLINLADFFTEIPKFPIKIVSIEQFINQLIEYFHIPEYHELILRFLLRQGWLDGQNILNISPINILQIKTQKLLHQLKFEWLPINKTTLEQYLKILRD